MLKRRGVGASLCMNDKRQCRLGCRTDITRQDEYLRPGKHRSAGIFRLEKTGELPGGIGELLSMYERSLQRGNGVRRRDRRGFDTADEWNHTALVPSFA